ncbi:Transposase IS66 family protein [compost metagenome]
MADMVGRAGAALTPLAGSLHRMLLTRDVLHADETPLQILDTKKGGKARSGYLWAYVSGEKSGPAVVCFESQPGRSSRYAAEYLKDWAGSLVVDGYPAYETLAGQNKGIALTGCWAHARRNFADLYKASKDPRAEMAVRQIAGLYRLEKKIRQWRQRYARPVLETAKMNCLAPHAWLTDVLQRLPGWPEEELDTLLPLPGFVFGGERA